MALLIGITGQIGAGKSTAAKVFSKMSAGVINADEIGRNVVERNPRLLTKLSQTFGKDVLTSRGNLRRKRVAQIAFSNKSNKKKLDRLVHPFLLKEVIRQIKLLSKKHNVIVIDAALLLEWHLDKITNKVLVIQSGSRKRLRRLKNRGIATADALARQQIQLTTSEFRNRADKVILNNGSKREFEDKVRNWAKHFFKSS